MAEKKGRATIARIMDFAGTRRPLTAVGCTLVAISMVLTMMPYVFIWLVVHDLIAVAPRWGEAASVVSYGWTAFGFAVAGIVVYFFGLMCTHLAAFRIESNMRKACAKRLMAAPLGYYDSHASGILRRRMDAATLNIEQLFAHNLADISGTVAMFVSLVILLFVFDWRMGLACFATVIISVVCIMQMMSGKGKKFMAEYQTALDRMSKASTEYVRGIPVVKVFQQTVYSFTTLKRAIDEYSAKAEQYQGEVCATPQSVNLSFIKAAFVFLIPVTILLVPRAIASGDLASLVSDFAFYAIFSALISTALSKIMFAAGGMMQASDAMGRIDEILSAPQISVSQDPQVPADNSIEFRNVGFAYEGAIRDALDQVSFTVPAGSTVALVGPSGGGKTTAASLIPRFWDADVGSVLVGGVDVRKVDPRLLMDQVAFVFQNNRLFKTTILENVRAARPEATRKEALEALAAAQCSDIIEKLPEGADTVIGTHGTYLSGGEQQRIALARAILKDAPIVVLDEATAFADPENEDLIQKVFARLAQGRTVVMIAHRLSTVVNADSIVVLDEGRVAEEGMPGELRAREGGIFCRMAELQLRSAGWAI